MYAYTNKTDGLSSRQKHAQWWIDSNKADVLWILHVAKTSKRKL